MPISRIACEFPVNATAALQAEEVERGRRGSIALDQWRGLALVLVLISHGFFFTGRVNGIGRVGVNLFFFISGILVFRSLSRSKARTQWQNASRFWWRRFRRLYPALLSYVLAMLVGTWLLQNRPNLPQYSELSSYLKRIPAALGYVTNYVLDGPMALGHLWSLSCEMQFYLVAPLIFLPGRRMGAKRIALFAAVTVILVGLGLLYPLLNRNLGEAKYHFEFAVWPMMLGFFCEAIKDRFAGIKEVIARRTVGAAVLALPISTALMLFGMEAKLLVIGVGTFLLLPCFLAYLHGLACPGWIGEIFAWMGERTYSIYLWQQPFTICNFWSSAWHPIGSLIAVGIGALWFRVFEMPFLSANRQKDVIK